MEKWKKSLSSKYFGWSDSGLPSFPEPQWQWLPFRVLVAIRILVTIYVLVMLPVSFYDCVCSFGKWFIYLTNWSYLTAIVYCPLLSIVSVHALIRSRDDSRLSPAWSVVYSGYWALAMLSLCMQMAVTIGYWVALFNANSFKEFRRGLVTSNEHGITFILLLIDAFLSKIKIRWQHFYLPTATCVAYVIFHIIYLEASSDSAYGILDHSKNKGKAAIFYILITLVAPLASSALCFAWYRLRVRIARKSYHGNMNENAMVTLA